VESGYLPQPTFVPIAVYVLIRLQTDRRAWDCGFSFPAPDTYHPVIASGTHWPRQTPGHSLGAC